jgi:glycosyltransferase involved in cell wall biosynthesis
VIADALDAPIGSRLIGGDRATPVSVVVPTRDRTRSLRATVRSIMDQRYPGPVECIVVFDGRPIPSEEIVPSADASGARGSGESRTVRMVANDRAPGPAGARNTGVLLADSPLVAFCDDDDRWHSDKLRLQVEALARHPEASACASGITLKAGSRSVVRLPPAERIELADLLRSRVAALHTSTLLVAKHDYVDRVGPMDEAAPGGFGDDYGWLLRAARIGPIVVVRSPLVSVRSDVSSFEGRWALRIEGIRYLLDRHPELAADPRNRARLYGRMAFAAAALGRQDEGWRLAREAWQADPRQLRSYLAMLVLAGLLPAGAVSALGRMMGRGV